MRRGELPGGAFADMMTTRADIAIEGRQGYLWGHGGYILNVWHSVPRLVWGVPVWGEVIIGCNRFHPSEFCRTPLLRLLSRMRIEGAQHVRSIP